MAVRDVHGRRRRHRATTAKDRVNNDIGCGGGTWLLHREVIIGQKWCVGASIAIMLVLEGQPIKCSVNGIRMRFFNSRRRTW